MTIDEAKRVRIVDFLAQLGHRAQYMKSEQYWYLSPLSSPEGFFIIKSNRPTSPKESRPAVLIEKCKSEPGIR
jgi:hypothetical protein